jgi:hypothetical protein
VGEGPGMGAEAVGNGLNEQPTMSITNYEINYELAITNYEINYELAITNYEWDE